MRIFICLFVCLFVCLFISIQPENPYFASHGGLFLFGCCYVAAQLVRQVQQEHTQVVCRHKVAQKRLARRHSRKLCHTFVCIFFFLDFESTQLARRVHLERAQVEAQ